METRVELGKGNPKNHKVEVPNFGITVAEKGDTVKWVLKDDSNIQSFEIKVKWDPFKIWSREPECRDDKNCDGDVRSDAPGFGFCKYSIHWKDSPGGHPHPHDPIISIRPGTRLHLIIQILLALIFGFVGFFAVKAFTKKKK